MLKLIAKATVIGVVVYAVAETLNRLKVADKVVDLSDALVTAATKLIPGDAE